MREHAARSGAARRAGAVLATTLATLVLALALVGPGRAHAAAPEPPTPPVAPVVDLSPLSRTAAPSQADDSGDPDASATVDVQFPDVVEEPSNAVVIILLITVLSIAPSLLVLCTSFTRIVIVLSLARNALGIPNIPPQPVVVGLSVFLTFFVMGPTFSEINDQALQPLLAGEVSVSEALDLAEPALNEFLLAHTRDEELELFLDASGAETPVERDEVPLTASIPAFVLSELKTGFVIGFVIFVPFLIIDLVVSAVLMGLGMMMLPPSFVSLPFKILLFVMLDGWVLVTEVLVQSYR